MIDDDIEYEFAKIEDRTINYVSVTLRAETDSNIDEGEFTTHISSVIGSLNICPIDTRHGVDCISLINECICENMDEIGLYPGSSAFVVLKESGEWEGYRWLKYYVVERVNVFADE